MSSSNSALLEIAAISGQDTFLTPGVFDPNKLDIEYDENSILNPFESVYYITIKFAQTEVELTQTGTTSFGGQISVELGKSGVDLVHGLTLECTLPRLRINPASTLGTLVKWAENPAHTLVESTYLSIGGTTIEEHTGMWYDICKELMISNIMKCRLK